MESSLDVSSGKEKRRLRVFLYLCVSLNGIRALTENSSVRPRVNVKTMLHYADLELHFVYLDFKEITKLFAVTLLNTHSFCSSLPVCLY